MALTFKLFMGQWCPSCRPRGKFIDRICTENDYNLEVHLLEEAGARKEAAKFKVKQIPMIIVFDEHENILVHFGPNATENQITKWLEEHMSSDL